MPPNTYIAEKEQKQIKQSTMSLYYLAPKLPVSSALSEYSIMRNKLLYAMRDASRLENNPNRVIIYIDFLINAQEIDFYFTEIMLPVLYQIGVLSLPTENFNLTIESKKRTHIKLAQKILYNRMLQKGPIQNIRDRYEMRLEIL